MEDDYVGQKGEGYFHRQARWRSDSAQRRAGRVFLSYVRPSDTVIDFGCGTGAILSHIPCRRRIGIEINELAVREAREKGIEVFSKLSKVPDRVADVVISHHALEHVSDPFRILDELRSKLKPDGRIVIVVPAEDPRRARNRTWHEKPDRHLFCWTGLTLGNLLSAAGYEVEEAFVYHRFWERCIEWARGRPALVRSFRSLIARLFRRIHTIAVAHLPSSQNSLRQEFDAEDDDDEGVASNDDSIC